MGFRATLGSVAISIMKTLGEDAVYTPAGGGDPIACYVVPEFDVQFEPDGMTAQTWQSGTVISALLSQVLTEPDPKSTFLVQFETGDVLYTVKRILSNNGIRVKMAVK
jgi:hypothetical protein